jgi:hypothetical protein
MARRDRRARRTGESDVSSNVDRADLAGIARQHRRVEIVIR